MMMPRLSVSGLSILTAHAEDLESTFGLLSPNRLGLDLAWIAFAYLSVQLVSIPFAVAASRDRFIGVLDGMASLLPLGISLGVSGRGGACRSAEVRAASATRVRFAQRCKKAFHPFGVISEAS
jgi:hypothetical protein